MRRLIPLLITLALVFVYSKRQSPPTRAQVVPDERSPPVSRLIPREPSASVSRFHCDGRTHCSQMTSCEEATFFIEHCPDTRMDGDNDGIPCEQQWCGH